MAEFVRVARQSELPEGTTREVELNGRVVALFNINGNIFAIDGICPHAGGPLGEGFVEGTTVTCPWHGWQFDLGTGRNPRNAACEQQRYEVKLQEGEIFLSLP